MRCFEVDDRVKPGVRIVRCPEPRVPLRGRERLHLDPKLKDFIRKIPRKYEGDLVLEAAVLSYRDGSPLLSPEPPDWSDEQALVHVTTQTLNGTVAVTSTRSLERSRRGRKRREWLPFPGEGVTPVLGRWPVNLGDGALSLELVLVMEPSASFRIIRTGELEGASPEIVVHWSGGELSISVPSEFREMHGLEPLRALA
jgi:hypothetical protein